MRGEEEPLLQPLEGTLRCRIVKELKLTWRIFLPGTVFRLSLVGSVVVSQMFLGHDSSIVLSAFAVVQSVIYRFVNGIMIGMSSATETLCGQAFGAAQNHMLGIYLQRSWVVNFATVTLCLPLFIFSKQILTAIGQNDAVAAESGVVSLWFIPIVYAFVFVLSCQMYLQSQMKNRFIGWVTVPAFVFHVILCYLLAVALDIGLAGVMIPLILVFWSTVIGEFVYIFGGWCADTWKGFTFLALSNLWPMVKLSVSSGIMVCLELWYNAIIVLAAGYMVDADIQISAFSVCLNINALQLMICLGFLTSASVRVSNELGRGEVEAAKFAMRVNLITSAIMGLLSFILCLLFHKYLAFFFTTDNDVVKAVSELSIPLAFSMMVNSFQSVLYGISIGSGLQNVMMYVNLGSYYVVGLPLGIALAFLTDLKTVGLWMGMLTGVSLQVVTAALLLWRNDWDQEVAKASKRLKRFYVLEENHNHP